MKVIILISIFLIPCFCIQGEETIASLSSQAEALAEAHDFATASQIYEKLLALPLPPWQKERVLYNIGTLRLEQQHPTEALIFFQKINPVNLSLARFGRNLLVNEGIAYLQYAQSMAQDPKGSLDPLAIFITQSLKTFDQAKQLECEELKQESAPCQPSFLLNEWMKTARLQLVALMQRKRQNWMDHTLTESLASLLVLNMQDWMDHVKAFQEKGSSQVLNYFRHQAQSFIPIWDILQQKDLTVAQKRSLEQSFSAFKNALQSLEQRDYSSAFKQWMQSMEVLAPLTFQDHAEMRYVGLNYDMLLLQNHLTASSIQEQLKQIAELKVDKEQADSLEQVKESLQASLNALHNGQQEQAQFYLIAGYSSFQTLLTNKSTTPADLLQQAIDQTQRTLQLALLTEAMPKEASNQVQAVLKKQQKRLFAQVAPFVPAVLQDQDIRFHQTKDLNSRCQQTPWDQVIPLYDQGFRLAQNVEQTFQQNSMNFSIIIPAKMQVIQDWKQALDLILHPPQEQGAASTPQKWAETFRQIQEMYLQDQAQPQQESKELNSW